MRIVHDYPQHFCLVAWAVPTSKAHWCLCFCGCSPRYVDVTLFYSNGVLWMRRAQLIFNQEFAGQARNDPLDVGKINLHKKGRMMRPCLFFVRFDNRYAELFEFAIQVCAL